MDPALALSFVSTTAIVGSVIFAGLQVRNAQRQRSKNAQMARPKIPAQVQHRDWKP